MSSAIATLAFADDASRHFKLPADGLPSLVYVFGPVHTLGAWAYSAIGKDFEPGASQSAVRLDFWADEPWTDVVEPDATFTIWYGGDVGHEVVEALA
jgi:hypothetical protein